MKRTKQTYEESLPIFPSQRRELREDLDYIVQYKMNKSKNILKKVKK